MANFELPRRGSVAANALSALHSIGGTASIRTLMRVTSTKKTRSDFCHLVVDRLVRSSLINEAGDELQLTDEGKRYLGSFAKPEDEPSGPVVAPRYVPPFRARTQRSACATVFRAGAFDYRDHPSRIGDDRVDYKGPTGYSGATTE